MKQAILVQPGKIEIQDVPRPDPASGEVLIQIHSALTCGTDLKAYMRGHSLIPMPGPFGHEYSGTVAKVGKRVREFKEGDEIMGVHSAPCYKCAYCRRGLHHLCLFIMDNKVLGAFSEYLLLPSTVVQTNLFLKPADLSFEEAALLEPLACVVHPYSRLMSASDLSLSVNKGKTGKMDSVETALVMGAGPIGLLHVLFLRMLGIKIIVCDFFDDRLSIAEKIGADIIASPKDVEDSVRQATKGIGVDMFVECTGQYRVWESSLTYVRRGGLIILFGGCPSGTSVCYDAGRLHYDELTLMGSFHYTPEDVKTAYQMFERKDIDFSLFISGEYAVNDIEKALVLLEQGKGIKYAIKP